MAKKNTMTLDIDFDDESPLLDDSAILFFETDTPGYLFADDLNHIYRLSLARLSDIPLDTPLPLYTYHDILRLLNFYLVDLSLQSDNPTCSAGLQPTWSKAIRQSKILILRGQDSTQVANSILHDFNAPPADPDPLNPELQHHADILLSYQQRLTSVYLYNPSAPSPSPRKAAKERHELETLLTNILDHLDLTAS